MFTSLLLSLLISAYATVCHAGGLTGGAKTNIENRPYVASLQLKNGTHICGAALYNKNTVITSGQCLLYYKPLEVYVRVGTDSYDSGGELIPISGYIVNKKFNFATMHRDIAVVKMERSVEHSDKLHTIRMAKKQPKTGKNAVVTGWNTKKQLVNVPLKIIRWKDCGSGDYIFEKDEINNKMICVEPLNEKVCDGEAGSPLVYKEKLIGLVSWAYTCANKGNPYVYTNVVNLRKWVKKAEKQLRK